MKKVYIVYSSFYDKEGKNMTIGGIQTYIKKLVKVFGKLNITPIIVQSSDVFFEREFESAKVIGVGSSGDFKKHLSYIKPFFSKEDLILFASEVNYVDVDFTDRVMVIQHGIYWDNANTNSKGLRERIGKITMVLKYISMFKKIKYCVCVDYNFQNWFRAVSKKIYTDFYVIPNCTDVGDESIVKPDDCINIIFARRFFDYRGTRVFAEAIKNILNKHDNINVTIAGEGPDEKYLTEQFKEYKNVLITKYDSEESFEIHKDKHIAVIPTLFSEGTSLSLLEAMSAKCAAIATDVGGMTDIVVDGFNGRMVKAGSVRELESAIEDLINSKEDMKRMADMGYQTVKTAFSYEKWARQWEKTILAITDK